MKQCTLKSARSVMTTWLESRPDVKLGTIIELKEVPKKHWEVIAIYDNEIESTDLDFHRKWDNNNYDKHQGLNL